MTQRWFVLLGSNELNAGFVDVAADWGASLAIVDWNERVGLPCERHIRLDIKAVDPVAAAVAELPGEVVLAYTSADVAVETAATINARHGLARPPAEAVRRAGNKVEMDQAWSDAGLSTKFHQPCDTAADLAQAARALGRKLIVKPVDASSSKGVTVVEADAIAAADWDAIFARASSAGLTPVALLEEYVEGTEYTVEMLGDADGNVEVWGVSKKYHTRNTGPNRIAVKLHYNPPDVEPTRLQRIAQFGADCFRALGLRNALGHFEVIEHPSGRLAPVEMAARSSGYIGTHLVSVLSGTPGSYLARYRDVLHGQRVTSGLIPSTRSSMYFFYDPPPGQWVADTVGFMDLLPPGIDSFAHSRSRLHKGKLFSPIDTDNERYGFEVLAGGQDVLTIGVVEAAERELYRTAVRPADLGPAS